MKLKKRILKSSFVLSLGAFLIGMYIWFVYHSTRWDKRNMQALGGDKPLIMALWHGRLMMVPCFIPKNIAKNVVVSTHSDGEIIARVQKYLGVQTIRGSTNKGGIGAVREIIKKLRAGESVAITPDGPRGPARKVNGTIIEIAKKLDIPIIPATFSCGKHKKAKSWDSFMVAKPFGKGVFIVGDLILPSEKDFGAEKLEKILNQITDEADLAVKTL